MGGKNSPNPIHHLFLPTNILKLIFFAMVFVQQKNLSNSSSINTTLTEKSQFLNKEEVVQQSKDTFNDISLRKHFRGCGGTFTVQRRDFSFRIFTPDYPLPYPSSLDCIYDIRFEHGFYPCNVDLRFEDFYLDSLPPDCIGDRLEVGRQRFCGGYSGAERFETKWAPDGRRHLVLRLVTDLFGTGRGFRICLSPIPCIGRPPFLPSPSDTSPSYPPISLPTRPPFLSQDPPYYPTVRPPWYPSQKPPYIPANPIPPSIPANPIPPYIPANPILPSIPTNPIPPLFPPPATQSWYPSLPFCCGTQYQGRRIYVTSPGFPYQLPSGIDCGYVINRISPRVTHLRITFKYFFLPCPWATPESQIGFYPQISRGYLSFSGRHFCGCQTGLSLLIPFGRFERSKFLRLYSPYYYSQSKTSDRKVSSPNAFNNSSSIFPDIRKTNSNFNSPPADIFISGVAESSQTRRHEQAVSLSATGFNRSSSDVHLARNLESTSPPNSQSDDFPGFQMHRQTNSASSASSKEDKTFYRPTPAMGFLLEISQVEIPYFPGRRKGKGVSDGDEINLFDVKSDNISLPSVQNASSRSLNLPNQSCGINDLPWIRWWLWVLRRKNLLQECPLVPPRPSFPPYYPPSNCGPFYPISGEQNPTEYQNEPYPPNSKCCST